MVFTESSVYSSLYLRNNVDMFIRKWNFLVLVILNTDHMQLSVLNENPFTCSTVSFVNKVTVKLCSAEGRLRMSAKLTK